MKKFIHEKSEIEQLDDLRDQFPDVAIEDLPDGYESWEEEPEEEYWELLDRKDVMDSDGFYTKYSLYKLMPYEDKFVTVFGDPDLYRPEDGDFDMEFDSEEEAYEFFGDYNGFDDED